MITFVCNKQDYTVHELLDFSRRANVRVIVRGYARITPDGIIFTGGDDDNKK